VTTEEFQSCTPYEDAAPPGWNVVRCGTAFSEGSERGSSNEQVLTVSIASGIMPQKEYESLTGRKLSTPAEEKDNYKRVHVNDIVYNKMRMWQGAVGVSAFEGVVSPAYVVLRPKNVCPRFAAYQLQSPAFVAQSNLFSYGIVDDQNSLRFQDFKGMFFVLPPGFDQIRITDHLDQATESIDKQRALLVRKKALLQEQQKAAIREAVTKGLDASAPMKASGVEWIGDVPQHWGLKRVKDIARVVMGQAPAGEDVCHEATQGSVPFLQGCAEFGKHSPIASKFCVNPSKVALEGDVLFSVRAPVGRTNTADQAYAIGRGLCALQSKRLPSGFLKWLAQAVIAPSMGSKVTGSTFEAVSVEDIRQAFVSAIERQCELIQKKIDLLGELRASIIHEAVTKGVPSL
jgi:hypothetical protein